VAYVSQGLGGSLDIFLLSADGQSDVNLTSFTSYEGWPSWSPDGLQIAFESNGGEETDLFQTEIYVLTVGIPGVQRLTDDTAFTNAQPAWSPLGNRIAFVSDRDSAGADIYLMNPNGTTNTRITTDTTNEVHPAWAPDGSKIAFATDRDGDNGEVYVMDTTGANLQRLTNDLASADVAPAWSPDGAKIAFQSTRETGTFGIWVMDAADGGNPARISPAALICELPSWTPDGLRLAFDCNSDIWVANANGSGLTRITRTTNLQRGEIHARWRPEP
jgi:Tol biopolymer transport system component